MGIEKGQRPHGTIRILDDRGFVYFPKALRHELDVEKGTSLPFFVCAAGALIVRQGCSLSEVLESLDVLKQDIQLRWREEQAPKSKRPKPEKVIVEK